MNTSSLDNYGISQMETQEMKAVNGGVIPVAAWYIGAFLVGVAAGLLIAHKS